VYYACDSLVWFGDAVTVAIAKLMELSNTMFDMRAASLVSRQEYSLAMRALVLSEFLVLDTVNVTIQVDGVLLGVIPMPAASAVDKHAIEAYVADSAIYKVADPYIRLSPSFNQNTLNTVACLHLPP
jgi:hypothetical protein